MSARPASRAEIQVLEANAVAIGVTIDALMEQAGRSVAEEARRHLPPPPSSVGIVCGLGNNGGDGLAAATALASEGFQARVWLLGPPEGIRTAAAKRRWELVAGLRNTKIGVPRAAELRGVPLVIDAMTGTGGRGELREPYLSAVREILASKVPVLSIDQPTGLGTSTPLPARWTVALEVLKEGMGDPACGQVEVRPIGIPPEAYHYTGAGEFALFPTPGPRTRKSDSGRLAVVGGGPYAGAPFLAGMGALQAGTDMVFVFVPAGIADVVQSYSPGLIVRGIGSGRSFQRGDGPALLAAIEAAAPTALLVGNGAGGDPQTLAALDKLVEYALPKMPVALDADGLRILSSRSGHPFPNQDPSRLLLTPNRREFRHLMEDEARAREEPSEEEVRNTARFQRSTILVKGPEDIISDGEELKVNRVHHPAMVVGGAGDVLAGVSASLMGRGSSPFQSARLASIWLGRTSLDLFEQRSYSITPQDLLDDLGPTLKRSLDELRRLTDPGRPSRPGQE